MFLRKKAKVSRTSTMICPICKDGVQEEAWMCRGDKDCFPPDAVYHPACFEEHVLLKHHSKTKSWDEPFYVNVLKIQDGIPQQYQHVFKNPRNLDRGPLSTLFTLISRQQAQINMLTSNQREFDRLQEDLHRIRRAFAEELRVPIRTCATCNLSYHPDAPHYHSPSPCTHP